MMLSTLLTPFFASLLFLVSLISCHPTTMSHLQYFDQPGAGEEIGKMNHYSQALRIDNRIEISGQGQSCTS